MTDNLSATDRRKTMRAVKSKDTKPERRLFAMLAGMRLRGWCKHANDIIGKPDVVFREAKIAIFVDGCFWHGCPTCKRPLKPQSNHEYWESKISRNVQRAQETNHTLEQQGWQVIRIWEHEIQNPTSRKQINKLLRQHLEQDHNG
jgi:DNA mismatch endonuclease (patch repair protein)